MVQRREFDQIDEEAIKKLQNPAADPLVEVNLDSECSQLNQSQSVVSIRKHVDKSQTNSNRLSVVSSEGSKNNSESIDVLTSTECTTTPESDVLSFGLSTSTSSEVPGKYFKFFKCYNGDFERFSGFKQNSESLEILGESVTSLSSVDIIGSDSANSRRLSQHTDEFVSPLESPCVEGKLR